MYLETKYKASGDEAKLNEITDAWKQLGDDTTRSAYDKSLRSNQLKCSFCGTENDRVKKLIAGPGVYICNECVELTTEIVDEGNFQHHPDKKCSFCGLAEDATSTRQVISGPGVYICTECVDLCSEIFDDELFGTASGGIRE